MKACGIVVEYNPFHNGHYYHLQQAKNQTNADCMIAVMSGNFLQRGEPALLSKWERAKCALMGGADLVVELPYPFATAHAPLFAKGSISLLHALRADAVCFGSEAGNIDLFYQTIEFLSDHKDTYEQAIKSFAAKGYSYPKAASLAFETISSGESLLDLTKPNNILGFEYVKTIVEESYHMKAETIKRMGAGYHDLDVTKGQIASATGIRNMIFSQAAAIDELRDFVPLGTYAILKSADRLLNWEAFFPFLQYRVLSSSPEELKQIYEMEEGLEYRLKNVMKDAENFQSFMHAFKTKRYTWTRLQRLCLHLLNNVKKQEIKPLLAGKPPYIRILGMSKTGQAYLHRVKKKLELPLVTSISKFDHPMLELEKKTSSIYALVHPSPIVTNEYGPPIQA